MSLRRKPPGAIAATALVLLLCSGAGVPWGAAAAAAAKPRTPAPASPPAASRPPAVARMQLLVQHAYGSPPFTLVGSKIAIRGIVTPYVAGQQVKLSVYRDGRKIAVKVVRVLPGSAGAGQFRVVLSSAR